VANLQRLLRLGSAALNPARVVQDALDAARRTAILIVCALVAVLILLPAVGCAAAGLWIYVQHKLGPVWAAFITAAAFLIASTTILLIGIIASKRRRSQEPKRDEPLRQINAIAGAVPAALTGLAGPRHISAASAAQRSCDWVNRGAGRVSHSPATQIITRRRRAGPASRAATVPPCRLAQIYGPVHLRCCCGVRLWKGNVRPTGALKAKLSDAPQAPTSSRSSGLLGRSGCARRRERLVQPLPSNPGTSSRAASRVATLSREEHS
jgi:hypothetical protein